MTEIFAANGWLNTAISQINNVLWTYILVAVLIACAILFTIKTRGVQFRMMGEMIRLLGDSTKKSHEKHVSSFEAFAVSIASRVGTGNLAGVATAIAVGGPGAIFWMWVIALLGSATAFVESTLAQLYKRKTEGSYIGGPAYYMMFGLHKRWMARLYAVLITVTFCMAYISIQSNTICGAMQGAFGVKPWVMGILLVVLSTACVFGGINRIAKVSSIFVPVMAVLYILLAVVILAVNIQLVPRMFALIIENAFGFRQFTGGTFGAMMMTGIKRGLFSNEAGMGSAPNAAASASVSHPVKQGLVQTFSVFLDTIVICSCSAVMIMFFVSQDTGVIAWGGAAKDVALTNMGLVQAAMQSAYGQLGLHFMTIAIFAFAFSSLIGNYFYAESNFKFITDSKVALAIFRLACCVVIFFGANSDLTLAWNLADIFMGIQATINIVVILILGKWALKALDDYTAQKQQGLDPVFVSDSIPGLPATVCWHESREHLDDAYNAAPLDERELPEDDPAEWTELISKP